MKKIIYSIAVLWGILCAFASSTKAQCAIDASVYPNNIIMCPNTTDTLWTQEYDTYQWYQNDSLIVGATQRFYEVEQYRDAGTNFHVVVTDSACTDTSEQVLVDGWVFLLPYVMHGGDEGWSDDNATIHICEGDTFLLTLGMPYDTNITWFNGTDTIYGENGITLKISSSGSYTLTAAPSLCPNMITHLGVYVNVVVHKPIVPIIYANGDTLISTEAQNYRWFFEGDYIQGATNRTLIATVSGEYTVFTTDSNECTSMSDPYTFTVSGVSKKIENILTLYPNPSDGSFSINIPQTGTYTLNIREITGKVVYSEEFEVKELNHTIEASHLTLGIYFVELINHDIPSTYLNKLFIAR